MSTILHQLSLLTHRPAQNYGSAKRVLVRSPEAVILGSARVTVGRPG
jgi:hypothetical protein